MKNKQVIIFNSYDSGSTGTICGYLKNADVPGFIRPILICSNEPKNNTADSYIYRNTSAIYRKIESLKANIFNLYGFVGKHATSNELRRIENALPDDTQLILSIHQIESSLLNLEVLLAFAKKHNAKVFITLHDCWLFTGKCPYYDISNCKKWKSECDICEFKKEFPPTVKKNIKTQFKKKIRLLIENKEFITLICPSNWMAEQVRQSALKSMKIVVVHNGIEIESFKKPNPNNAKIGLVAAASPWTERKGLKYLKFISNNIDYNRFSLTVIGVENDDGFSKNTILYGIIEREKLLLEFSKNDYFLNPTLEDNFPTTNIEALSQGLKVVSFKTGGSCESFDENTGYQVDRNENDFLETILKLEKNHNRNGCKKRAEENFSKNNLVTKYYNLFNDETK